MNRFEWVRASSFAEASELIAKGGPLTQAKAAGIDLWDRMKEGLDQPERVVSILEIPGGGAITVRPDGSATIGALATISEIAEHAAIKQRFSALAAAAGSLATPSIRNAATIGGNLCQRPRCHYFRSAAHPCLRKGGGGCFAIPGDHRMHALFDNGVCAAVAAPSTAAPLVALGAEVVLVRGAQSRRLPVEELFVPSREDPRREVRLGPGELIERIEIPAGDPRNAYDKVTHRESFDWPIVEVAVALRIGGGAITEAKVVLGAVAMTPRRAAESEKILRGAAPGVALFAKAAKAAAAGATPLPLNRYKLSVLEALVARTLAQAVETRS
jgi:xanthine dehydrogenase YagS FAD-binding subunit